MTATRSPATPAAPDPSDAADLRLRAALQQLPVPAEAARIEALEARILAQWQVAQGASAQDAPRRPVVFAPPRRRWVLGSGLALGGAALVLGLWLEPSDPVLEELLQPDVLSQMAIGEM